MVEQLPLTLSFAELLATIANLTAFIRMMSVELGAAQSPLLGEHVAPAASVQQLTAGDDEPRDVF